MAAITPQRVLHVLGGLDAGGVETLIMNFYRRLDVAKYQFDFAVHASHPCFYDGEALSRGARIFYVPHPSRGGLLHFRRAFSKILGTAGPFAAVHSHVFHFSGYVLTVAKAAGVPIRISHSHTICGGRQPGWGRRLYRAASRRLLFRNGTLLLGCTPAACQALYGIATGPRVRVLPNAIDILRFDGARVRGTDLRNELGVGPETFLAGHVGRFSDVKNHERVIQVFAALRQSVPGAALVLAGNGERFAAVQALAARMGLAGCVKFLGTRADVPSILSALNLFLFPSHYEGLGMAVIEAQAAGIPSVVSDRVPLEADLGLGLVRFLPLAAENGTWVRNALAAAGLPRPSWDDRLRQVRERGYDIYDAVQVLQDLYANAR